MPEKEIPVKAGAVNRRIDVDYLARVEGEGSLLVDIRNGQLNEVKLKIFEPPRFFEAFLRGRDLMEAPDITARICGICPVAYMMSAVHALEGALNVDITDGIRQLRRLLYCGEWIESHTLHVFMLHAPDFLGFDDAIQMAKDHGDLVQRGLRMKKLGNDLIKALGGREIHPINIKVGGFYKLPDKQKLMSMLDDLRWAREAAAETARWAATLDFPELQRDYEFVALSHDSEYPMNEGGIRSSAGLNIRQDQFLEHFEEIHLPHSNALHSLRTDTRTPYFVGPMARYHLCRDTLSDATKSLADDIGFYRDVNNPFESIVIRCVEVFYAFDEAIRLIEQWQPTGPAAVDIRRDAGVGMAATEAPRGLLFHRYEIDEEGMISKANIIPPTSQNQSTIEADLYQLVEANLSQSESSLTWLCEQSIRNYDPCISCATHFLKLDIQGD